MGENERKKESANFQSMLLVSSHRKVSGEFQKLASCRQPVEVVFKLMDLREV